MVNNSGNLYHLSCNYCNQLFQDGEILTFFPDNSFYHTVVGDNNVLRSKSCFRQHFPHPTHNETYGNPAVYFSNKLYDPIKVVEDREEDEIVTCYNNCEVIPNDSKNGDRLVGNIEELLEGYPTYKIKEVIVE